MDLFCFASRNEENIWRGYEARLWAVSKADQGRRTKAKKYLTVGSRGILYCGPVHSFTVPFLVESPADPLKVVSDVWPEPWVLPFKIKPLGPPSKKLHADSATLLWPYLQGRNHMRGGVTAAMNITGVTVFVPIEIGDDDWSLIIRDLGDD